MSTEKCSDCGGHKEAGPGKPICSCPEYVRCNHPHPYVVGRFCDCCKGHAGPHEGSMPTDEWGRSRTAWSREEDR